GCPSDRVQSGTFGACLMRTPTVVADCIDAMRRSVSIPVTVKCRIGVDDQDPTETLPAFVHECAQAGAGVFIVHARKAWLQGLSPKDNREIPPLDYELVAKVKSANPELTIVLNGGITSIDQCHDHLECFDGVMLGRSAYHQPRLLTHVDQEFFGDRGTPSSVEAVVDHMDAYVQQQARQDVRPNAIVRHIQGLAHGLPGARRWRRLLTEQGTSTPADILRSAYEAVADEWSASLAA
ncbi:MAG: tRNA dihydrouridine(20/20a) synthase DusA, partial [Pseudomonadota bacterium]